MVGAAGFEPATLCLATVPALLRGLDYIFGISAALLIVSEDSPPKTFVPWRGCLLIALPRRWAGTSGFQHTAASSRRVHPVPPLCLAHYFLWASERNGVHFPVCAP